MPEDKKITGKEKVGAGKEPNAADLAADYQWSMALLNSDPELRKAFRKAVKQGWTAARFTAEIQDTKWFKKNSAAWRQNEVARLVDPATWKAARKTSRAGVGDLAARMGVNMSDSALHKIADQSMMFGWSEAEQRNALSKYIKESSRGPLSGQFTGDAGRNHTMLLEVARRNAYVIPKGKIDNWLAAIARGDSTVDDYAAMMRKSAAAAYPGMADQLEAGADLEDLASPYRQSMARLLELPEDKIDLRDGTLSKALTNRDAQGKAAPMALYDFEDAVRKDSRWQYTSNARDSIMSQVYDMGRQFGKTG